MKKPWAIFFLFGCVVLACLMPLVYTPQLLYPTVSGKVIFFRILIEVCLPVYIYLIARYPALRSSFKQPFTVVLFLYIGVSIVSAILGDNPVKSLWGDYQRMGGVFTELHFVLLYLYLLCLETSWPEGFNWAVKTLVFTAVIASVYGLLVHFGMHPLVAEDQLPRISASFGNPNFFAAFLIFPIAFALMYANQYRGVRIKTLWYGMSLCMLAAVYYTGTRAVLVGLALGSLSALFTWLAFRRKNILTVIAVSGVVLCVIAGLFFLRGYASEQSALGRLRNVNDANTKTRLIEWLSAYTSITQRPLLGNGPENYYITANQLFDSAQYAYTDGWADKPHNYYLEIASTRGLSVALLYLSLTVILCAYLWRLGKKKSLSVQATSIFTGALVAYAFQNAFGFEMSSSLVAFMVFSAFVMAREPSDAHVEESKNVFNGFAWPVALSCVAVLTSLSALVFNVATARVLFVLNRAYAQGSNIDNLKNDLERAARVPLQTDRSQLALSAEALTADAHRLYSGDKAKKQALDDLFSASILIAQRAVLSDPNNAQLQTKLANLNILRVYDANSSDFAPAETALDRASRLAPERVEADLFRIKINLIAGNVPKAQKLATRVMDRAGTNPNILWIMAQNYSAMKQVNPAAETATKAIQLGYKLQGPADLDMLNNYYADAGDYAKVTETYERYLTAGSQDPQLYLVLLLLYVEQNQQKKALNMAHQALEHNPQFSEQIKEIIKLLDQPQGRH